MKTPITAPTFIRKSINTTFDRLYNQIGMIDSKNGKPILNSKTTAKLETLKPFMGMLDNGEKIPYAMQVNVLKCIHISIDMTAKLQDVCALSSACSVNPTCQARSKDCKSICSSCFAFLTFERYNDLEQAAIINFITLNAMVYDRKAWKEVNVPTLNGMFRIEAFGDVGSAVQAANYILMIKTHTYLQNVGIWSKNLGFWNIAFKAFGKPSNVTFNASSPVLNEQMVIKPEFKWFIDHVFTVYDCNGALENNVEITCGDRICAHCKRCYTRNNDKVVNEILKQESKRYYKAIGKTFEGRK